MKQLFKFLAIGIVVLLVSGLSYQAFSTYTDDKNAVKSGDMIDVGGYRLYTEDIGSGHVTVVFDSGMGDDLSVWGKWLLMSPNSLESLPMTEQA